MFLPGFCRGFGEKGVFSKLKLGLLVFSDLFSFLSQRYSVWCI